MWEYDFIAIHVITGVLVLRIQTASISELVTGPVLSQLVDVTGLICMNIILRDLHIIVRWAMQTQTKMSILSL